MEAHRILGPGFPSTALRQAQDKAQGRPGVGLRCFDRLSTSKALAHEFDPSTGSGQRLQGISYQRQAKLAVQYKGVVAGEFRADFPSTSSGQAGQALRL